MRRSLPAAGCSIGRHAEVCHKPVSRDRALGVGLIVVAACGFGSGPLLAKPIYGTGVDWLTLLAWRFLVAAVISWGWLLVWPAHRRCAAQASPRRLIVTALLGVFFVGNSGTYFAALETVDASLSALIVYVYPALVAVITLRFGRRLEGRRAWAALVLASLGVALAVGGIDPAHAPPPIGLALIISSPIIYAVWIVLAARLSGERASRSAPLPPYDSEAATSARGVSKAAPTAAVMLSATALAWWIAAACAWPASNATANSGRRLAAAAWRGDHFDRGCAAGLLRGSGARRRRPGIPDQHGRAGLHHRPRRHPAGRNTDADPTAGRRVGHHWCGHGTDEEQVSPMRLVSIASNGELGVMAGGRVVTAADVGGRMPLTMAEPARQLAGRDGPDQSRDRDGGTDPGAGDWRGGAGGARAAPGQDRGGRGELPQPWAGAGSRAARPSGAVRQVRHVGDRPWPGDPLVARG